MIPPAVQYSPFSITVYTTNRIFIKQQHGKYLFILEVSKDLREVLESMGKHHKKTHSLKSIRVIVPAQ
jgi:hypothetical protein